MKESTMVGMYTENNIPMRCIQRRTVTLSCTLCTTVSRGKIVSVLDVDGDETVL